MRTILLLAFLALVTMVGCEVERRTVSDPCVSCFDYDGHWAATYSTVMTDSNGSEDEESGDTWLTIDQMGDALVFSGVVAKATEGGLYFDSIKTFDSPWVGKVSGRFVGESDPLDPMAISLTVEWSYYGFDPVLLQTVDYEFVLQERIYP